MTIPQNYKYTDLGLIPQDWKVVKLSEVIDNFTGLTYAPNNVKEYGFNIIETKFDELFNSNIICRDKRYLY